MKNKMIKKLKHEKGGYLRNKSKKEKVKDKHNAELQRADPGTKVTG